MARYLPRIARNYKEFEVKFSRIRSGWPFIENGNFFIGLSLGMQAFDEEGGFYRHFTFTVLNYFRVEG